MSDATPTQQLSASDRGPPQRSSSARSTKSHESVAVLGAHPYGSLQVVQPGELPPPDEGSDEEEEAGSPPPLEPITSPDGRRRVQFSDDPPETRYREPSLSGSCETLDTITHSLAGGQGGDVLLVLDLPEYYLVGCDTMSFTARQFRGVRDIPPGPHFFWVTHPDSGAVRTGFFIMASGAQQVHVLQWDKFHETISEPSRAEARFQAEGLDTFNHVLVPYNDPSLINSELDKRDGFTQTSLNRRSKMWKRLAGSITQRVLVRVIGQQTTSWHVDTTDRVQGALHVAAEMELDRSLPKHYLQSKELKFSFPQNAKTYTADVVGADRTLAATDATSYMMSVMNEGGKALSDDDVVAELQLAFIIGVHLGNHACIQQWWHMVLKLVLKAFLLPELRPVLAAKLLYCLAAQLEYSARWLDETILDPNEPNSNELRLALIIYKRRLDEVLEALGDQATKEQRAVGTAFAKIESEVVGLGWELDGDYVRKGKVMMEDGEEVDVEMAELQAEDERGEWAPEVVELDEHGRQRDLVSWHD
ncbi:AAR2 domain-containing protein [Trichoderma longibrachiatum]